MIELTNYEELRLFIRKYLPHSQLDKDNYGQLIIYTGYRVNDEPSEHVPIKTIVDLDDPTLDRVD